MAFFRSRAALQFEILALRHRLGVLPRSVKRPQLTAAVRFLGAWLAAVRKDWQPSAALMKPATVIGWHRKGFRLFWTCKIRRGNPGRPAVPVDLRSLIRAMIRAMSRDNPLWGAPRIHGELLKLGLAVGETSVSTYRIRNRKPPSQTWRTFLENHVKTMVSVDVFTVPTIRFQVLSVFAGAGARPPPDSPLCRDRSSHRGVDHAATPGSLSLGHRAPLFAARSPPDLRERTRGPTQSHGDQPGAVGTAFPLATG